MGNRRAFFALTPSPSPTLWERGVGAHSGAPRWAFPLSRSAGEGDKGGEGKEARLPFHARAGKVAPAAAILCRTDVPLSDLKEGVIGHTRFCELWLRDWYDKGTAVGYGRAREEPQGAPPCAPTPLSHRVGEGLGMRAKKARLFPTQRTQVLYPYQNL